jgi:hypothetical protein
VYVFYGRRADDLMLLHTFEHPLVPMLRCKGEKIHPERSMAKASIPDPEHRHGLHRALMEAHKGRPCRETYTSLAGGFPEKRIANFIRTQPNIVICTVRYADKDYDPRLSLLAKLGHPEDDNAAVIIARKCSPDTYDYEILHSVAGKTLRPDFPNIARGKIGDADLAATVADRYQRIALFNAAGLALESKSNVEIKYFSAADGSRALRQVIFQKIEENFLAAIIKPANPPLE